MGIESESTATCDNPSCTNGEGGVPSQEKVAGSATPGGWIQFSGAATINSSSVSSVQTFCSVKCATSFFENITAHVLSEMGARQ